MKSTDRMILLVLPLAALVIGFYLLVIAPKRAEMAELNTKIDDLNSQVANANTDISGAEAARDSYDSNYADIVKLGAAAPDDNDQATFVYSMTRLGQDNSVQLRSWELAATGDTAAPAEATPAPAAQSDSGSADSGSGDSGSGGSGSGDSGSGDSGSGGSGSADTAPVAATPTEATVSTLPLGATVGPAGLPLTPYSFNYSGTFFDVANLMGDLDSSVSVGGGDDLTKQPTVRGRLVTVDGFALVNDGDRGFPRVSATLALTTYSVPADQGVSAGATPAGPPTVASDEAATLSSTPATTATVTP